MQINPVEQFRDAIQATGLIAPGQILDDGELHRFASNGKRSDDSGWYVLYGDNVPAGSFGCWRTGISQMWRADMGRALTPAENDAYRTKLAVMRHEREAEDAKRKAGAKAKAADIWSHAEPAPVDHPYLVKKGVQPHGLRFHQGRLIVPMHADGQLHSLQFITEDGGKLFLPGGRVKGCYHVLGEIADEASALLVAEGYATAASLHEATSLPVVCAFSAGNLGAVASTLRARFPDRTLILCADDDYRSEGNPGLTAATEAARIVCGLLALPAFVMTGRMA